MSGSSRDHRVYRRQATDSDRPTGRGLPSARMLAAALVLTACLAGCGQAMQPPVYANTYGYLTALAQGNFSSACALLDSRARAELVRSAGRRVSCARAFSRCLPARALVATQDQSQLLYATVEITVHGRRASATLHGTPVANALARVTLAKEHGYWKLTSDGKALMGCPGRHRRRHARSAA